MVADTVFYVCTWKQHVQNITLQWVNLYIQSAAQKQQTGVQFISLTKMPCTVSNTLLLVLFVCCVSVQVGWCPTKMMYPRNDRSTERRRQRKTNIKVSRLFDVWVGVGMWSFKMKSFTSILTDCILSGCLELTEHNVKVFWVLTEHLLWVFWVLTEHLVWVFWVLTERLVWVFWVLTEHLVWVFWVLTEYLVWVFWMLTEHQWLRQKATLLILH